jgi:hypothetical protein
MRALTILCGFMLFISLACAQGVTQKLNGGLEASVLNIGRNRDHNRLTVSLRIANRGTSTAYLLLVDRPMAIDNKGGVYNGLQSVAGIARCDNGSWAPSNCLGYPEHPNWVVPLQSFTQIDPSSDPNAGIVVNFAFGGQGDGPVVSFSAHIYLRLVSDPLRDETVPEATKYKQFHMMTLSFPPMRVEDAP